MALAAPRFCTLQWRHGVVDSIRVTIELKTRSLTVFNKRREVQKDEEKEEEDDEEEERKPKWGKMNNRVWEWSKGEP